MLEELCVIVLVSLGQFHQHFTSSYYVCRSQERKKDNQVISHFALLGSRLVEAVCKHVGEIDPLSPSQTVSVSLSVFLFLPLNLSHSHSQKIVFLVMDWI